MKAIDEPLQRLAATIDILRPGNVIIMMLGVLVGFAIELGWYEAIQSELASTLFLAAISVGLIGAGANVLNDVADNQIDLVNRPTRVLPSGRMSITTAKRLGALLTFSGILAALGVSLIHTGIAVAFVVLLGVYNKRLKRQGFAGNLVVSIATAATLLFGALVARSIGSAAIGALFAFCLTLAREITKDIQDIEGDTLADSKSLPIKIGTERSGRLVRGIVVLVILLLPVPYMLGFTGLYFFGIVAVGITLLETLRPTVSVARVASVSRMLKYSMFLGMVALVLGRVGI